MDEKRTYQHVIYGDTDSCYASMSNHLEQFQIPQTDENCIRLANQVGAIINDSMPEFLARAFLIPKERGRIVNANREIVARSGLFKNQKKRYALHVIDKENKGVTPKDEMKIVGMEVRRSDTPGFIQNFLSKCLRMVVKDRCTYEELYRFVQEFREEFRAMPPWTKGSPGRVKNLTVNWAKAMNYRQDLEDGYHGGKKPTMHISVSASSNTNSLMKINGETRWDTIHDGDKIEMIYLLPHNPLGMAVVAIKTGETYVPDWFRELPFDEARMEEKLLDKKLFNIIGSVLDWNLTPPRHLGDTVFGEDTDFYS